MSPCRPSPSLFRIGRAARASVQRWRSSTAQWARRTLSGRATVLLVTDGLDHEHIDVLDTEMARLARFAHRIVWLNPLLRFAGFEPRARGVRAILPHVDVMVPAHHFDSLAALEHELAHARRTRPPRPAHPCPTDRPMELTQTPSPARTPCRPPGMR